MRGSILLFLLISCIAYSLCQSLALPEQQSKFEGPKNSEYSIQSSVRQTEDFPQIQRQRQEFIYPNNFRNAYQYQYKSNIPLSFNQRQWASASLYGNGGERLKDPYNVYSQNNGQNYRDIPVKQSSLHSENLIQKQNDHIKSASPQGNKLSEFLRDQQRLGEAETVEYAIGSDLKDSERMERKSAFDSGDNDFNFRTSQLKSSVESHRLPVSMPLTGDNKDSLKSASFEKSSFKDVYFVAIVACISTVAIFGVIGAGYCFHKIQQSNKAAADVDYPAYGVVGPVTKEVNSSGNISPSGDRKLAQSAQMYHYHHQKQQMIASEKAAATRHTSASDNDSDEENEEGEYTVYECPGLAPTGEMEVKNPLFHDDITPVSSPPVNGNVKEK